MIRTVLQAGDVPEVIAKTDWYGALLDEQRRIQADDEQRDAALAKRQPVWAAAMAEYRTKADMMLRAGEGLPPRPDFTDEDRQFTGWANRLRYAVADLRDQVRAALVEHADELEAAYAEEWQERVAKQAAPLLRKVEASLKDVVGEANRQQVGLKRVRQLAGTLGSRPVRPVRDALDLLRVCDAGATLDASPLVEPPEKHWRPRRHDDIGQGAKKTVRIEEPTTTPEPDPPPELPSMVAGMLVEPLQRGYRHHPGLAGRR